MRRPVFSEGIIVAILASLIVTVVFTVLSAFFPTRWLLQALIAGISFSYVCYLLVRSQEKIGRLTAIAVWGVVTVATWMFSPSMIISLFIHLGMIWLVRALYYYTSLLVALLDLGLILFGMAASIWTMMYTHSLFLSVWCFFLIQSLFVLLPSDLKSGFLKKTSRTSRQTATQDDAFEQAYTSAKSALRQLTVHHS
ncbi:MAG: hypothetical protein PVG20_06165 [Thioalkalispiraceae bacterium]|jgi:hypothetical protein